MTFRDFLIHERGGKEIFIHTRDFFVDFSFNIKYTSYNIKYEEFFVSLSLTHLLYIFSIRKYSQVICQTVRNIVKLFLFLPRYIHSISDISAISYDENAVHNILILLFDSKAFPNKHSKTSCMKQKEQTLQLLLFKDLSA